MSNIHGEYTLAEVAAQIRVSPAWINKIRSFTGIGGDLGVQGKKSNFTDKDLRELKKAKSMRLLELDYGDLKKVYEIENELLKFFSCAEGKNNQALCLLIHTNKILINEKVLAKNERLKEAWKEYCDIFSKVYKKVSDMTEEIEKVGAEMKHDLSEYEQLKKRLTSK